jgi:predicted ATPase
VTVLIGRSGTGKSNFVRAIRLFRDLLRGNDLNQIITSYGGWSEIFSAISHSTKPLGFSFTFTIDGYQLPFRYSLFVARQDKAGFFAPAGAPNISEEIFAEGDRIVFHLKNGEWLVRPGIPSPDKPTHGVIQLRVIPRIQEVTAAYQVLADGIGCYDFPGNVLQGRQSSLPPQQPGRRPGLSDVGENFIDSLAAIRGDLRHLDHWRRLVASLRQINGSIDDLDFERPQPTRVDVLHRSDSHSLTLELSQESEGFRRYLAHLVALYQVPSKYLLAFEEPEKGLYPGAMGLLAEEFKECSETGRGQVLLTTHSPQLLDAVDVDGIRVVDMERYATKIGPISQEQLEAVKDQLESAGELLTIDPARLATPAAIKGG